MSAATVGVLGLNLVASPAWAIPPFGLTGTPQVGKLLNKAGTRIVIGNATLTAVNGTTLTVKRTDDKVYTVNTDSNTRFRARFWGKISITDLQVNDKLNIVGTLTDSSTNTVSARLVRDLNLMRRKGAFFGNIQSIDSTNSTFVLSSSRGTITVTVSSSTKLVNRKEQTITFADLAVGNRVRVKGLYDSNAKTLTNVTHIKDFSLPPRPVPTSTP